MTSAIADPAPHVRRSSPTMSTTPQSSAAARTCGVLGVRRDAQTEARIVQDRAVGRFAVPDGAGAAEIAAVRHPDHERVGVAGVRAPAQGGDLVDELLPRGTQVVAELDLDD